MTTSYNLNSTGEGTWDNWSSWGACSTTCDSSGSWSRSRSHTGNMPCIGSDSEVASCQSKIKNFGSKHVKINALIGSIFQPKEVGTIGAPGALVPQHVIAQEPGVDQGPIRAICHVMALIMRLQAVKVRSWCHQYCKQVRKSLNSLCRWGNMGQLGPMGCLLHNLW